MKRILIFSLAYYPRVGGAEVALKEITDRISDIEFHLITLNFDGLQKEERIGNIVVHRVGNSSSYLSKILFVPRACWKAYRLNKTYRFDALWALMTYMLFPIVLLRFLGVRIPYLLTLQDGDPFTRVFTRWFILPFRPLLSYGFKHATAVQAISNYLGQWAVNMGFSGTPAIVPNGVDNNIFAAPTPEAELTLLKETLGKKEGEIWLIHTGRMVHKNGVDTIIRALALLPESVHFLQIGIGQDEEKLKELAASLGVAERVHFHGFVDSKELPAYLAACDIFIRPSRSEGMGNSFVEAMAAGIPVIGTQEGGIKDFLFDAVKNPEKETTGFAVAVDMPEQIVAAVKYIQTHQSEVTKITETAKRMVAEKYDWSLAAGQMQGIFSHMTRV